MKNTGEYWNNYDFNFLFCFYFIKTIDVVLV